MSKEAYYFSHDCNAQDDPKCMLLIDQLGMEGYGIFWALIERLRNEVNYMLPHAVASALAKRWGTSKEKVESVIKNYSLFTTDGDFFYSNRLRTSMQLKTDKARKSANYRWDNANAMQADTKRIANGMQKDAIKVKESKVKEYIVEIVAFLNLKTGKDFKPESKKTLSLVAARLAEGYTVADFKNVISGRTDKWMNDEKMSEFLRPETLFGTKFESYLVKQTTALETKETVDFYDYVNGDSK